MDVDKGFFIENILKDATSEETNSVKGNESLNVKRITSPISKIELSHESDKDKVFPDAGTNLQVIGVLPTVYPVISNRLDTHEG